MNKIGKMIIIIVLIITLAIGGYFLYNKFIGSRALKDKIETASKDYFNKYISTNESMSTYKVTLNELISSGENYNLKDLENCDKKETYANITVDYKTGSPKKVEVKLKC